MKRGKVERLLKEHGSPPGVRVTAGGRIVQEGLTPLASPHFHQNTRTFLANYPCVPKLDPHQIPPGDALRQLHGLVVDVGGGQLCQIIDGKLISVGLRGENLDLVMNPINAVETTAPVVPYSVPHSAQQQIAPNAFAIPPQNSMAPMVAGPVVPVNQEVPDSKQLKVLENCYNQIEQDLKQLDRNEVLQRDMISPATRAEIAKQRVSMTNRLDDCRRAIRDLKARMDGRSPKESEQVKTNPKPAPTSWYQSQTYHMLPYTSNQATPLPSFTPSWSAAPSTYENTVQPFMGVPVSQGAGLAPTYESSPVDYYTNGVQQYDGFQSQAQNTASTEYLATQPELQQRAGNAGIGTIHQSAGFQSHFTYDKSRISGGYGEVGHRDHEVQGRRSHAVEIKKPSEHPPKPKIALDPKSPSYQPANVAGDNSLSLPSMNNSRAGPPPGLAINTENVNHKYRKQSLANQQIKRSPGQHDGAGPEGSDNDAGFRTSDSSATTADFFPQDPHLHSTSKYSFSRRDGQANLPAWMPNDGDSHPANEHPTPLKGDRCKFMFNDSPEDHRFLNAPSSSERPSTTIHVNPPRERLSFDSYNSPSYAPGGDAHEHGHLPADAKTSPEARRFRSSHQQEETAINDSGARGHSRNNLSISLRLEKAKQKAESSPNKTDEYWDGYKLALMKGQLTDSSNADFNKGYCDGLVDVHKRDSGRSSDEHLNGRTHVPVGIHRCVGVESGSRVPSMSRAASLPLMEVPKAPPNSAVDSPLRQSMESSNPAASISFESALTTPKRRADPLQTWSAREIGTQTSALQLRHTETEPLSPLAQRYSGNQMQPPVGSERKAARASSPPGIASFDQQRYPTRAKASVAHSSTHAAKFPAQYDGSADDDEKLPTEKTTDVEEPISPQISPSGKGKAKAQSPGSPVKRASSAVGQLLQLGGKSKKTQAHEAAIMDPASSGKPKDKDIDPAKMSSPDKARWRAKWKKNFATIKDEEDKEIAKYQKENPIPQSHR